MGRKGCRFKAREDLRVGGEQTVLPLLRAAFAEQWEVQTGHAPWFSWQEVGSSKVPVMTCPRCGIVGNPNDFWDQHSQEFCTRAIELKGTPGISTQSWNFANCGLRKELGAEFWKKRDEPATLNTTQPAAPNIPQRRQPPLTNIPMTPQNTSFGTPQVRSPHSDTLTQHPALTTVCGRHHRWWCQQ